MRRIEISTFSRSAKLAKLWHTIENNGPIAKTLLLGSSQKLFSFKPRQLLTNANVEQFQKFEVGMVRWESRKPLSLIVIHLPFPCKTKD